YQTQANDYKFSDYRWVPTSLIGLQLNVPIFNGFSVRKQLNQVRISQQQLDLQAQFTHNNLIVQIQNAMNAVNAAVKKVNSAKGNVELAQKGYSIAQTRYNTGQATLLELNDAENAMMQAKLNLIQAQMEYLVAKTDYEKIIGGSFEK
ncbi:MAG: TolC family protein, partial [Bacteroidales bacterium]|nr:TolC family protein [Bacteroidales bacterium]